LIIKDLTLFIGQSRILLFMLQNFNMAKREKKPKVVNLTIKLMTLKQN